MAAKWSIIIFVYFVGIMSYVTVVKTDDPKTLYEDRITEDEAAKELSEYQSNEEVLPLILFQDRFGMLEVPENLSKVLTMNRKIINGTKFLPKKPAKQIAFCPKENSNERCLELKNFTTNEPLRCASEARAILQPLYASCSDDETFRYYTPFYELCDNDKKITEDGGVSFYDICYHSDEKKTVYTVQVIRSAFLLNSKLLFREREVNYEIQDDLEVDNDETPSRPNAQFQGELDSRQQTKKSNYKLQKLVPAESMPFAVWKKTTFQRLNTVWQHEKLFDLWNEINDYIRYNAINMANHRKYDTVIRTGVFDINSELKDSIGNDQMPNIWIKFIDIVDTQTDTSTYGIVILMNNFIKTDANNDSTTKNSKQQEIEKYCDQNLCVDYLQDKFTQIGGHIRCCPVTEKMSEIFYMRADTRAQILRIPHVTDKHETLKERSITTQQAAKSVGEIQRNEVLPLILILYPYSRKLHFVNDINEIKTESKRIVFGTLFTDPKAAIQIFFCPKNSSNAKDKCLEPQNFDSKTGPLQCSDEPIPSIQIHPLEKPNACTSTESNTFHRVVYEICPSQRKEYKTTEIKLYSLCYNSKKQKVLFTRHTISSPKLLTSKILFRERAMEYSMIEDDELALSNLPKLKEAETLRSTSSTSENKSPYILQKLVPSEDMPFALWRKTTYMYANAELQHEKLVPLWNEINRDVRNFIINKNYSSLIYTGVFDIEAEPENDANHQKPNIWVKIIHDITPNSEDEAVVILMSNFITEQNSQSTSNNFKENSLNEYCGTNLCVESLQKKFENIGGLIRCCHLTVEMGLLFGMTNIENDAELLSIPNITIDDDF